MTASFERCIDLDDDDIAAALRSQPAFRALLERAVAVARPEEGGPKLLVAFARLAAGTASWLEGALRVELEGDDHQTTLTVLAHHRAGRREELFPAFAMQVPFDEFVRATRLVPKLIAPLLAFEHDGKLILATEASAHGRPSQRPTVNRMDAVREDVHTKPTVHRMAAVRPEDMLDDE